MVIVVLHCKFALFCFLLAAAVRSVFSQDLIIGNRYPCEESDDPDPDSPYDNLSCPREQPGVLDCYAQSQLCDGVFDCSPGTSDEGLDTVSLQCGESTQLLIWTPLFNNAQAQEVLSKRHLKSRRDAYVVMYYSYLSLIFKAEFSRSIIV